MNEIRMWNVFYWPCTYRKLLTVLLPVLIHPWILIQYKRIKCSKGDREMIELQTGMKANSSCLSETSFTKHSLKHLINVQISLTLRFCYKHSYKMPIRLYWEEKTRIYIKTCLFFCDRCIRSATVFPMDWCWNRLNSELNFLRLIGLNKESTINAVCIVTHT